MAVPRQNRGRVLVALTVAALAAILSLIEGSSGNVTAMALLTVLVAISIAVAAVLALRPSAAPDR